MTPDLRILLVSKLPRLCARGQRSKVVGLVLADQFTLHLPRGTDYTGPPLERGGATFRLREQPRGAVAFRLVAREQNGGLTLSRA